MDNLAFDFDPFHGVRPQSLHTEMGKIIDIRDYQKDRWEYDFNRFQPFDYQAGLYNMFSEREWVSRGFVIMPRRAGKTIWSIIFLIIKGLEKAQDTDLPFLRYGLVYPDLSNGKEVAWEDMDHYTEGLPLKHKNKHEGSINFTVRNKKGHPVKIILKIVGLKNLDGKRGGKFDGIIIDEIGFIPAGYKKVVDPMTADKTRQPTFQIKIGTPNEEHEDFWADYDSYKKLEQEGDKSYLTFWTNYEKLKHLPEDKLEEMRNSLSPEEFSMELLCRRGVQTGARYYADILRRILNDSARYRPIPSNRSVKKTIICDVGSTKTDLFALWVAQPNSLTGRWELIDYTQIPSADEEKVSSWINEQEYNVGQIILPWDGGVGMRSPQKLLQERFPNAVITVLDRASKKIDMIRQARIFFGKCDFNSNRTQVGINCLKFYSKKFDKVTRIYQINPKHDKYSHGAEAFGYMALADQQNKILVESDFSPYNKEPEAPYEPNEDLLGFGGGSQGGLYNALR